MQDVGGGSTFSGNRGGGGVFAGEVVVDVEYEVGLVWLEPGEGVGHIEDGQGEDEEEDVGCEVQRSAHDPVFLTGVNLIVVDHDACVVC